MRRVCLIADDDPSVYLSLPRALAMLFGRAWGPNHGIELITARSLIEGDGALKLLAADFEVHCVLITDYELGDGLGSELITVCRKLLGQDRSLQVLQSGSVLSDLLNDPVVKALPRASLLAKPVRLAEFEALLPQMAAVWGLSLEG